MFTLPFIYIFYIWFTKSVPVHGLHFFGKSSAPSVLCFTLYPHCLSPPKWKWINLQNLQVTLLNLHIVFSLFLKEIVCETDNLHLKLEPLPFQHIGAIDLTCVILNASLISQIIDAIFFRIKLVKLDPIHSCNPSWPQVMVKK